MREHKLRQKRHHVEKLLAWKQRLDKEESRLKSLEKAVLEGRSLETPKSDNGNIVSNK